MKPPLPPQPRDPAMFGDAGEWNDRIAERLKKWDLGEPGPCSCGFWEADEYFCGCSATDRKRSTPEVVQKRLHESRRYRMEKERRDRRKWPGKEAHADAAKGHCKWCGDPIFREDGVRMNLRKFRHDECKRIFLAHIMPDAMRRYVFQRDQGRCAACGTTFSSLYGPWDADHIQMLAMAEGDGSLWHPDNVRILCREPCHIEKSKQDAKKLAAYRAEKKSKERYPCPSKET